MQNELKEKLENLSEKFNTELDIISLKALCNMPESEEILFAITGTLNRLIEKYPDDEEILGLLPKKEKISLEELINLLEEKYSGNVEVITIKALSALPEGEAKESAIKQCLERLLEINSDDENILEYLEIEQIILKEKNPDMVFVEGGSYTPSFYNGEKKIFDLYVDKYMVTEEKYLEIMGKKHKSFLCFGSFILPEEKDMKKPKSINWIYALEYCNKISKKYGLKPVYIIEKGEFIGISQLDGKEVAPDKADFEKTEGYRLPTELEWEWFAFGGKKAQQQKSFDKRKFTATEIRAMAWDTKSSPLDRKDVGLKLPNELGLYDVFGNMVETVYDSCSEDVLDENTSYIFDSSSSYHVLRGGDVADSDSDIRTVNFPTLRQQTYTFFSKSMIWKYYKSHTSLGGEGIRIVRTANPKRK